MTAESFLEREETVGHIEPMDAEERLKQLRAELADMTARIETVREEVLPQAKCAMLDAEREQSGWLWLDSAGWLLFALAWH